MKLSVQFPPHIRSKESNLTVMTDVIIALIPIYLMAAYFYGIRAVYLMAVSVGVCALLDILGVLISRRIPNIRDLSSIVTGMIIPLLMPATVKPEIVVLADLFAILVAKHPFGGVGQNVFNPAVSGVAFAIVCWPNAMFSYCLPFEFLPIHITEAMKFVPSPAKALSLGGVPAFDFIDMLLGNVPGAMGATNILLLFACFLFLSVRRTVSFSMTGCFLMGASLVAVLFPRAEMSGLESFLYEMMSGYMLIGAIFLINDPVTSPKRTLPKLIYGFTAGIVGMSFRHIGRYEESLLFAILVMNSSVWILDLFGEQIAHYYRRKQSEYQRNTQTQIEDEKNDAYIQE